MAESGSGDAYSEPMKLHDKLLRNPIAIASCKTVDPFDKLAAVARDAPLILRLKKPGGSYPLISLHEYIRLKSEGWFDGATVGREKFNSAVKAALNIVHGRREMVDPAELLRELSLPLTLTLTGDDYRAIESEARRGGNPAFTHLGILLSRSKAKLRADVSDHEDGRRWELAVRIAVPKAGQPQWRCELCGVDPDDESVMIHPLDEAASRLSSAQRERILTVIYSECERVAELWEPLKRITPPETKCEVTADELVGLLLQVGELKAAGVRVRTPKELITNCPSRVRKKCVVTDATPRKPGSLNKDVILRFEVNVAIDGESLNRRELQEMAGVRESLIKLRGKWLYVNPEAQGELRKLAQMVVDYPVRHVAARQAVGELVTDELRNAAGANTIQSDVTLKADGLQKLMDAFRQQTPAEVSQPAGLADDVKLRPYQVTGLNWLAMVGEYGLGGCLADDMGLGKTLQTLAWLQHRRESGINEPALLVCPTSVMSNWEREAAKFTPNLRVFRQHGPERPDDDLKFFARARKETTDLVITSFATMCRDLELFQNVSWKWSAVILDEAQNIKNHNTAQSKAARQLSAYGATRLALTGTPVENGPRDLWAIMEFLNPGMLGTWTEYLRNDASPIEKGEDSNYPDRLRSKIQPFLLRRKKTDPGIADDLPPKIEQTVWCSLTREQAAWYQAALNNMRAALKSKDHKERQSAILKVLSELKQVCNGVAALQKDRSDIYSRAGKIDRLCQMLSEVVDNGEKAIVFSQYPGQFDPLMDLVMDRLKSDLGRPVGVLTLTGEDSVKERDATQVRFADDARFSVVLISLRAGGTGLNMQSASHVFHLDRWWNAAVEDQATDRAWRIGQNKIVHAHKFVCRGTLEERIDTLISKKRQLAGDLLGDASEESVMKGLLQLDADALLDVLRIDEAEAVQC